MKKKTVFLLLVFVIIITVFITILITGQIGGRDSPETDASETQETAQALEIDPNAGAETEPEPETQEPGVAIPGWGSITLPAGVTEANVSLTNPTENTDWYYLTFELSLKDTGEVLFTTGLIPPGQACNKVTLTRELEAGEYVAVLHVQPYRMSDQTPTNSASMELTLIVEASS
ncbi:MAG: hypothetical protein Q4F41_17635 [Eubacteriales bacterium]|nr:hypothetical protein [Eubacteriales bacterium]